MNFNGGFRMNVLVIGGAGRLGTVACQLLLRNNYKVTIFDLDNKITRKNIKRCNLNKDIDIIWGDIVQTESIYNAIQKADAVVHMAAILPPLCNQNPELAKKVSIDGT